MTFELPGGNDHPSWLTIGSVAVGYGIIMTVVLLGFFIVPYLVFTTL